MLRQIDTICNQKGIYPHAFLSAHAHNYQRNTRIVRPAVATGGLILEKYNDQDYGYLRISVDAQQLRIGCHVAQNGSLPQSHFDLVTVDLASHTMFAN